jgi:hypothetical protein
VGCGGVFVGVGIGRIVVNGAVEAVRVATCEDVGSVVDVVGIWEVMGTEVVGLGVGEDEEEVVDMIVCVEIFGIEVVVEVVVESWLIWVVVGTAISVNSIVNQLAAKRKRAIFVDLFVKFEYIIERKA